MNVVRLLFILVLVTAFQACSSNPEKSIETVNKKDSVIVPQDHFATGTVIDKVTCNNDPSQNYSLYLPRTYDGKKSLPIIYAFDAHGTGKLPVNNYKELAEKYGYILVGSNNSQNGLAWEQSQQIAATLMADTKNRLMFDANRVYALGFSGGARVANALTINNGAIAGVICCGAASPAVNTIDPRNNYTFFGIAGNADFNYTEMKKYDMLDLAGHNVKHALITFDGIHEWPKAETMQEAFLWLELNAMRKNASPKNDSLISHQLNIAKEQLSKLQKANKEYDAYELCRKVINYYEALGDLTPFFDAYKALQNNSSVDKQLKQNEADWNAEEKLKQTYMGYLQDPNFDWQKDIAAINQKIKAGKNSTEALIQKRLLSYLSLVCYMQTSGALKQNNIPAAAYFGKLYKLVDPPNTEADYLLTVINMKLGKTADALKYLEQSIKNGFVDSKRLEADSAFVGLKNDAAFLRIKSEIK